MCMIYSVLSGERGITCGYPRRVILGKHRKLNNLGIVVVFIPKILKKLTFYDFGYKKNRNSRFGFPFAEKEAPTPCLVCAINQ